MREKENGFARRLWDKDGNGMVFTENKNNSKISKTCGAH